MIGYRIIPPTPGIALAAAPGVWAFVSGSAATGLVVSKSVTAGDLLVVANASGTAGVTPTISDGVNTWTQITASPVNDASNGAVLAAWMATAATTASITVTISASGSAPSTGLAEYSFSGGVFGQDGSNKVIDGAGSTTTDAENSGSVTTAVDGDLIISIIMDAVALPVATTFNAGTGWTKRATACKDPGGASNVTFAWEDRVQTTHGAINPTWTGVTTDAYDAITIAIKKT